MDQQKNGHNAVAESETAAVTELLADIAGEMRLHIAHVLEFLDGTKEEPPVEDEAERARLSKAAQILGQAVEGLAQVQK